MLTRSVGIKFNCTYCRENSICGNSCRHTALPLRGKLSRGTLCTCCLLPSLALCLLVKKRQTWHEKVKHLIYLLLLFFKHFNTVHLLLYCNLHFMSCIVWIPHHNEKRLKIKKKKHSCRSQIWTKHWCKRCRLILRGMFQGFCCLMMGCGCRIQIQTAKNKCEVNPVVTESSHSLTHMCICL